jgi:hypothetical protein
VTPLRVREYAENILDEEYEHDDFDEAMEAVIKILNEFTTELVREIVAEVNAMTKEREEKKP